MVFVHNAMMTGPPGAGKTLLARSMPSILPRMTTNECLEVTKIYSVAESLPPQTPLTQHRPFRAPHHTISHAGLVGGGRWPRPGEISLSHRGVLFLDELPEFSMRTLEVLIEWHNSDLRANQDLSGGESLNTAQSVERASDQHR